MNLCCRFRRFVIAFLHPSLLQLFCNFCLFITKSIKYCNVVFIRLSEGYLHAITELQINTVKLDRAFDYYKKGLFSIANNSRLSFETHKKTRLPGLVCEIRNSISLLLNHSPYWLETQGYIHIQAPFHKAGAFLIEKGDSALCRVYIL